MADKDKNQYSDNGLDETLSGMQPLSDEDLGIDGEDVDALIRSVLDEIDHADSVMQPGGSAAVAAEQPDLFDLSEETRVVHPVEPFTEAQAPIEQTRIIPTEHSMENGKEVSRKQEKKATPKKQKDTGRGKQEKPKQMPNDKNRKPRLKPAQRALIYVFCVITASVLLAIFAWCCALDVLALTKPDREVTVTVRENDTVADVTDMLYDEGLIEYKWLFRLYCAFAHAENKIDPGVYTLNNLFDYHALVNGLIGTADTRETETVTIPEGYECEQIFELLDEKGVCSYDELVETAANYEFDYAFLSHLDYGEKNRLEGYLFPDTYEFYLNEDAVTVLKKFLNNFEAKFNEELLASLDTLNASLRAKMEANGFSEEEIQENLMDERKIVIVASLIEKETAGEAESANIASVIYNRLCSDVYPCLQIDATIQYVLEERKQTLTAEDLAINSPYNTYTNPGLTPGPIANPGLASLKAALNPAQTDYYFYALDTDGTHHFSSTYYEHKAFLESLENE